MDDTEKSRQLAYYLINSSHIFEIWDAASRGDLELVRDLVQERALFHALDAEYAWPEMALDDYARQVAAWFLENLIDRFERHGNVVYELDRGGETRLFDGLSECRRLLARFKDDEPPQADGGRGDR